MDCFSNAKENIPKIGRINNRYVYFGDEFPYHNKIPVDDHLLISK